MSAIKLTPEVNIEVKDILSGISTMDTRELEQFLKEVAHILVKRKAKTLSKKESELLTIINKPLLANKKQKRFNLLYQKLRGESLTEKEHEELMGLNSQQEAKAVERLRALVELSQIRKLSLDELLVQLGIQPIAGNA